MGLIGPARRAATAVVVAIFAATMVATPGHAVVPVNDIPPSISGTPTYGQTLTAVAGGWTPDPTLVSYQWLRNGLAIAGANAMTYQLQRDDIGASISVQETASDGVDAASSTSAGTAQVAKASLVNLAPPELAGRARLGRTLTADRGSWTAKPSAVDYQWMRGQRSIDGATKRKYRLGLRDFGKRVRVLVTVRRAGYTAAQVASQPKRVKHRVPVRRTVTFHVETRGRIVADLDAFAELAQATYDDPRGWRAMGVRFRQVRRGGDFTLVLAQAAQVTRFSSACSATWSCRVGRYVIINQTRWQHASPAWNAYGRSLRDYRHMVVNHETGHWLGRGHRGCPGPGRAAPVMMQQSKGLGGCRANPWPIRSELGAR